MKYKALKSLSIVMCLILCSCSVHEEIIEEQSNTSPIETAESTALTTAVPDITTTAQEVTAEDVESCGIPKVYITFDTTDSITLYNYINAEINIDCSESALPSLSSTDVLISGRGHSTWLWDKKPYKLKFETKTTVLGLPEAKKWILLANYSDKTLIRNNVAFSMSNVLSNITYTPKEYFVELYINGEYMGLYTLGEHIDANEGRVDIEKNSTDDDTGYLLEVGGSDDDDVLGKDYFSFYLADRIVVKSPDSNELTNSQYDYIFRYVRSANDAIVNLKDYEDFIDVDSFIDWQILHELSYNMDSCFRRSCFITKPKGGKLTMGPVWDFDLAFGNFCEDNSAYSDWVTLGPGTLDYMSPDKLYNLSHEDLTYESYYITVTWYNYLMLDTAYVERLKSRWNEIKTEILDTSMKAIDEYTELLNPYLDANFERWDCLGKQVGYESGLTVWISSYDDQISYLKDFITKRYNWLDDKLNN